MPSSFSRDRKKRDERSLRSRLNSFCFRFVVDGAHHGLRIDTFLASRLRNHVTARIQRMASAGLIFINDVPSSPDRRLARGEEIRIRLAEPPEPFYPPEPIPLEILYDDPWIVAVNKPAGLLVHPAGPVGDGTLANAAQAYLDSQTTLPGLLRPGIVHRLDRATSGVILIAKDHISHGGLTREFERSAIEKSYVALVAGLIDSDETTIDLPIGQQSGSLRMSTEANAIAPRAARTLIKVLRRFKSSSLVEARPLSGRKHQIRVHLAAIGHPILGDRFYSKAELHQPADDETVDGHTPSRHALHAAAIAFRHPVLNVVLRVTAPAPTDFYLALADVTTS